jgi:hypothetical protein
MKFIFMLSLFLNFACTTKSTTESSNWSGAQRQDVIDDTTRAQQQENIRDQFPATQRDF